MTDTGFSPEEARAVTSLLDVVVPPSADGRLPGAGELGLVTHVAEMVVRTPMLRPVLEYGLSALGDLARARVAGGFADLAPDDRRAVLAEFTAADQFFLPAFLFLAYSGYYRHPRVVAMLGLEARAPHPEGYAMEPDDLSLLDPVRRRGRMYRQPGGA